MSLVLVSPSTLSWFQVRAAAGRSREASSAGEAAASVRMTASIVAIRGWIMPTPLAMPLTRMSWSEPSAPGKATETVATLVVESVVRRATAAASKSAPVAARAGTSAAMPAATRSSGSRVPMTPVERWRTSAVPMPRASATSSPTRAWSASPAAPVAALAQPLVETIARTQPSEASSAEREARIGAAAKAFGVKTAAAAAGPPPATIRARSGPAAGLDAGREGSRPRKPAGMRARRSTARQAPA